MIGDKFNYKFKCKDLLRTALTHSSYANECLVKSNERLEFLGDAVLGFMVAKELYSMFPDRSEGELSKLRSTIVSRTNFSRYARMLKIDEQILLGKGEENTGGREKDSNLAGAFEAVIAAVYLDGGSDKISELISRLVKEYVGNGVIFSDYKGQLQEISQKKFRQMPKYSIMSEEGPVHDRRFYIKVEVASKFEGEGVGRNKKAAEQAAAKKVLLEIIRN